MERCRLCDTLGSEDVSQRAHSSLERIVNQSVRVLADILFVHFRVRNKHTFTFGQHDRVLKALIYYFSDMLPAVL